MDTESTSKELVPFKSFDLTTISDVSAITSVEFNQQYTNLLDILAKLQDLKEAVDDRIKIVMEEEYRKTGVSSLDTEDRKYTYSPPTTRISVDSKRLEKEQPEIYAKYAKVTQVKATLRSRNKAAKADAGDST